MELLQALFENADLPTDFKEKTKTVFEASVNEAVQAQLKAIQESFDSKIDTEKDKFVTESAALIESTIEETVLEWAKENAVPLDQAAKATLAESFLVNLKTMFEQADIEMSSDSAGQKITELTESNTKLVTESQELQAKVDEANAKLVKLHTKAIIESVTVGLADTTATRVTKLCEAFEYKSDEDFRAKVSMVLEAVAGIKGTFSADGSTVAVVPGAASAQAQVDTGAGTAGPEDGELIAKPAGASVPSAEGDTGKPKSTQPTPVSLKEATEQKIAALGAPKFGSDLIAATMKQFK